MTGPSPAELAALATASSIASTRTPEEVLEALDPQEPVVSGIRLLPLTMGHLATLQAIQSPLVTPGLPATAGDIATALYVLSRPSLQTSRERRSGKLEDAVAEFSDSLPLGDAEAIIGAIAAHLDRAFANALPMKSPGSSPAQKKTGDSVGN